MAGARQHHKHPAVRWKRIFTLNQDHFISNRTLVPSRLCRIYPLLSVNYREGKRTRCRRNIAQKKNSLYTHLYIFSIFEINSEVTFQKDSDLKIFRLKTKKKNNVFFQPVGGDEFSVLLHFFSFSFGWIACSSSRHLGQLKKIVCSYKKEAKKKKKIYFPVKYKNKEEI